jgi:hypothetical protein
LALPLTLKMVVTSSSEIVVAFIRLHDISQKLELCVFTIVRTSDSNYDVSVPVMPVVACLTLLPSTCLRMVKESICEVFHP